MQDVLPIEPHVLLAQPRQAAGQQSRAHQQHQRERHLRRQQQPTPARGAIPPRRSPATTRAAPAGCRPAMRAAPPPAPAAAPRPPRARPTIASTRPSSTTSGMMPGANASSPSASRRAASTPPSPPSAASSADSARDCRSRRPRLPPIAVRIASSRWRVTARASSRCETFRQTISSSKATARHSTSSGRLGACRECPNRLPHPVAAGCGSPGGPCRRRAPGAGPASAATKRWRLPSPRPASPPVSSGHRPAATGPRARTADRRA